METVKIIGEVQMLNLSKKNKNKAKTLKLIKINYFQFKKQFIAVIWFQNREIILNVAIINETSYLSRDHITSNFEHRE